MFALEGKQRSELKQEAARLFPPARRGEKSCHVLGDKYVLPQIAIKLSGHIGPLTELAAPSLT